MILSHSSRFVLKFIVSRFIAAKVNLKIVPPLSLFSPRFHRAVLTLHARIVPQLCLMLMQPRNKPALLETSWPTLNAEIKTINHPFVSKKSFFRLVDVFRENEILRFR